jgi:hypothetical protein
MSHGCYWINDPLPTAEVNSGVLQTKLSKRSWNIILENIWYSKPHCFGLMNSMTLWIWFWLITIQLFYIDGYKLRFMYYGLKRENWPQNESLGMPFRITLTLAHMGRHSHGQIIHRSCILLKHMLPYNFLFVLIINTALQLGLNYYCLILSYLLPTYQTVYVTITAALGDTICKNQKKCGQ